MQKLLDKEEVMEQKNTLLQPIFRDLKSAIKYMTYTDEFKILKEYVDNRNHLIQQFGGDEKAARCQEGLKLLESEYAKLLQLNQKSLEKDPSKKLKQLQTRLEDMFQLLSLWSQYVEVVYMPESEIHVIATLEKLDARPSDSAFGFRTQQADIKNRIKTLFQQEEIDEEEHQLKEEYETVNEDLTSDTTEAPSQAVKRTEMAEGAPVQEQKE